jgi:hypothetical protein
MEHSKNDAVKKRGDLPSKSSRMRRAGARQYCFSHSGAAHLATWEQHMNNIIWLVGAVVIVLAILGFFGLR